MKKWMGILFLLLWLAVFSPGCGNISKETKIKCPKCGAIFTADEGVAEIQKKGH